MLKSSGLYGFGGSKRIFRSAFAQTLNSESDSWSNTTMRQPFTNGDLILPAAAPGRVRMARVTFQAGNAEGIQFNEIYIGDRTNSGDNYDFLSTPAQMFGEDGNSTLNIPAGTSKVAIGFFPFTFVNGIVVSAYVNSAGAFDTLRLRTGTALNGYFKTGNDASTVNASGYTLGGGGGTTYGINSIEMDGW
jgi:hypothetical protein